MTVWMHDRRGRIQGVVERVDASGWTWIRLTAPAWADVRRTHRHEAGEIHAYRTSFLREQLRQQPADVADFLRALGLDDEGRPIDS